MIVSRIVPLVSLLIAIVALVIAAVGYSGGSVAAERAIEHREHRLIEELWPKLRHALEQLGVKQEELVARPETIEEMVAPLFDEVTTGDGD